ncbi:tyrosine-protein kinase SRK3-like [Glandiceps talaboti]
MGTWICDGRERVVIHLSVSSNQSTSIVQHLPIFAWIGISVAFIIIVVGIISAIYWTIVQCRKTSGRDSDHHSYDEAWSPKIVDDDTGSVITVPYEEIPLTTMEDYDEAISFSRGQDVRRKDGGGYAKPYTGKHRNPYMRPGERVFEISRKNTHITDIIWKGQFHAVVKAEAWFVGGKDGCSIVAIKKPKDAFDFYDAVTKTSTLIRDEIRFLKGFPFHDNIVRLLGSCTRDDGLPYLIMEYSPYGDLKTFLSAGENKESTKSKNFLIQLLKYCLDVASAMAHLADYKITHRYLAARHVLVFEGNICKISNFMYSSVVVNSNTFNKDMKDVVPQEWMAPEVLTIREFSLQSDVWSFGVLMWEIFAQGEHPYKGMTKEEVYKKVIRGYRLKNPTYCPKEIYHIMSCCWKHAAKDRLMWQKIEEELKRRLHSLKEANRIDNNNGEIGESEV